MDRGVVTHEPSPRPGSEAELAVFARIQSGMADQYRRVFADDGNERTVVVVPSLSLDPHGLSKISGVSHYEERMLCLLMLLRMPRTKVIYVTSQAIHPSIIDYYLHLLPGIPGRHARNRLELFDCDDGSPIALTQKILDRPRLLARIARAIPDRATAHITCFNASAMERTLAVQLGVPLYACDPALAHLGDKSHGRRLMAEVGVEVPPGHEFLRDMGDVAGAIGELHAKHPEVRRVVVKLNEGFSGEGNAVLDLTRAPEGDCTTWAESALTSSLQYEAEGETYGRFSAKFSEMGGIVEAFVDEPDMRSPSVQARIDPLGELQLVSSHDQVLGGRNNQVFKGCRFPAATHYQQEIHDASERVGRRLSAEGVIGRFGLDFLSIPDDGGWRHYGLELNIRKGGTTLPFLMLQFLTDGSYDAASGRYHTADGVVRSYYASDNVEADRYRGLTPDDLIEIAVAKRLHFDAATRRGVVFHLIGALSQYGKLGVVCIDETLDRAAALYEETVATLDDAVA